MDDPGEDVVPRARPGLARIARTALAVAAVGVALGAGVMWGERRAAERAVKGSARDAGGAATPTGPAGRDVRPSAPNATEGSGRPADAPGSRDASGSADKPEEVVEVTLTPDAIERAGIRTDVVRSRAATTAITVPGTVSPNAYRETRVNALVGGIVRQVFAELGATMKTGERLAVVFSPELADAQTKYLSMRAMLQADHQKRARTERLVEIGAASRQELEEVRAVHAAHESEVAAARQRLLLLGLAAERVAALDSAGQVVSDVAVPSPVAGVVLARTVNPGQVVGAAQELFVVADLGTVWVIGDLYEKDFASVRVGSDATVTIPAVPGRALSGRVAYIDPRVDAATRTAKVRVEVPNRDMALRLGMYVTVTFRASTHERVTLVPRSAVQSIGARTVVYVPVEGDDTRFAERPVTLGPADGGFLQVLAGLRSGETIVTEGSFFLRAEAGRTRGGG